MITTREQIENNIKTMNHDNVVRRWFCREMMKRFGIATDWYEARGSSVDVELIGYKVLVDFKQSVRPNKIDLGPFNCGAWDKVERLDERKEGFEPWICFCLKVEYGSDFVCMTRFQGLKIERRMSAESNFYIVNSKEPYHRHTLESFHTEIESLKI